MEQFCETQQIANLPHLAYNVINVHWCKRRPHDIPPTVDTVELINYKQEHNAFCTMNVQYTNGQSVSLIGRVLFNDINKNWSINGVNSSGDNVTIRVNSHID